MSSILEALKKLEDEKTQRQSGGVPIASRVVRSRREKQRPKWHLLLEMTAVAAVAVLATYLIIGGRSTPPKSGEEMPAVENMQPAPHPQTLTAPPPQTLTGPHSQTLTAPHPQTHTALQPQRPTTPAPPPRMEPSVQPTPKRTIRALPSPSPVLPKETPSIDMHYPQTQASPPPPPSFPPPPGQDAKQIGPSLTLSGIGWRKDSADRLAIVNGRPVREGETIDGARVEEIYPDRVRFSVGDRTVEVSLGRSPGGSP